MPSRQTTIFAHFSPSDRTARRTRNNNRTSSGANATQDQSDEPGPSRRAVNRSNGARRTRRRSESESEGSDALGHILLSPDSNPDSNSNSKAWAGPRAKRLEVEIPLTQRRAMKKTIQDSLDEQAEEEEDGEGEKEDTEQEDEQSLKVSSRSRHGGKVAGRGTPARAVNRRKEAEDDNKLDDDIILYPSPLSPRQTKAAPQRSLRIRNGNAKAASASQKSSEGSIIVMQPSDDETLKSKVGSGRPGRGRPALVGRTNGKGKGKSRAEAEVDDDEIIPIDPPPPTTQRSRRTAAQGSTQPTRLSQTRGLQFRRTTSELEVHLPRLSQEERATYREWAPKAEPPETLKSIVMKLPAIDEKQASLPLMGEDERAPATARCQSPSDGQVAVDFEKPRSRNQGQLPITRASPSRPMITTKEDGHDKIPQPTRQVSLELPIPQDRPASPTTQPEVPEGVPQPTQGYPAENQHQPALPGPHENLNGIQAELEDDDLDFLTSGSNVPSPGKPSALADSAIPLSLSSDQPGSPKFIARSPSPAPSDASSDFFVSSKRRDKGKQRALPDTQFSDDPVSSPPNKRSKPTPKVAKQTASVSKSAQKSKEVERSEMKKKKVTGKLKSKTVDPDDDLVETEDEQDMVEHLKMDEPERFKSATRLRQKKESAFQRKLRKMKAQRMGQTISSSESEADTEGDEYTSDSAISVDNEDSFIVPDDNINAAHVQLPHYFSIDSAQTPEFKFKVVFHYLVLLVTKRQKAFPLSRDSSEYFKPQLHYWRDRMVGFKNFRVRSQIWHSNFVKAMEKYPGFEVEELPHAVSGCDACHMSGRRSKFKVRLDGTPYNKETHEELESSSDETDSDSSGSGSDSSASEDGAAQADRLPRKLVMGRFCRARAEVFHQLTHWEDELYHAIKRYYHDLLRAKYKRIESDSEASSSSDDPDSDPEEVRQRRERRLKRKENTAARVAKIRKKGDLPKDVKDVDKVTEWMDRMGYQNKEFRWIQQLEDRSGQLEHDKRGDD
ncbi:hypothetical protein IAU59_000820 [Kwoniella sp. CBS 9459]